MRKALIISLGNPWPYQHTRHSVGHLFIDYLAKSFGKSFPAAAKDTVRDYSLDAGECILLRSGYLMNLCGRSLRNYKSGISFEGHEGLRLLTVSDDLENTFLKSRIKHGGSDQ